MADFTWTTPKVFGETENVNSRVLNPYLSENDRYLFRRPRDIITLSNIGDFSTTSTTLVAVSTTALRLSITTQVESDLRLWLSGGVSFNNSSYRVGTFDILMDGDTYLSSDDASPLSAGLFTAQNGLTSGGLSPVNLVHIKEAVPAGVHFFDLYYAVNGSTLTLKTNPTLQFGVMEV